MSKFPLEQLVEAAKSKQWAQLSTMKYLMARGYSMTGALKEMRTLKSRDFPEGLGMGQARMSRIWKPLAEASTKVGRGAELKGYQFPGSRSMTVTPFDQKKKYNYTVKLTGESPATGRTTSLHVTVASSKRLCRDEIEEQGMIAFDAGIYEELTGAEVAPEFSSGWVKR